tara:strand:+ start:368 stop:496 length:129 start_codon:yes stop_codon:yes gene_type:complete
LLELQKSQIGKGSKIETIDDGFIAYEEMLKEGWKNNLFKMHL